MLPLLFALGDDIDVYVVDVIPGNDAFNYFFTLLMVFGLIAVSVGALVRIISKS